MKRFWLVHYALHIKPQNAFIGRQRHIHDKGVYTFKMCTTRRSSWKLTGGTTVNIFSPGKTSRVDKSAIFGLAPQVQERRLGDVE